MPPNIPAQAHIQWVFDNKISDEDRLRLSPHISNYNRLNEILVLNGIAIEDIQKLILLELEGDQRPFILGKLVGRLKSKERNQLLTVIQSCVKAVSKRKSLDTPKVKGASATNGPVPPNEASPTESSSVRQARSSFSRSKHRVKVRPNSNSTK